ncbi:MAG: alpha-amylase [Ignavibacteria bacterium]|jgi:glycosidase|nr:alpha-amylase [Ignavibacteria bacterium]
MTFKNKYFPGLTAAAYLLSVLILFMSIQQTYAQAVKTSVKHPAWTRNKMIYEVNIRQYTKSGTFKDLEKELPKLKDMGVGIVWLMPVNPIGEKNRKGTLGSYYAVSDYMAENPEFGTMKDFKSLVNRTHKLGMKIIIDWVANHTSWDNVLTKSHPEFFKKDSLGNFVAPVKDWTDVIQLDYQNKELWKYMIGALKFWITETGIDGFRCDVAAMVPTPFWNEARKELDKVKPVFMLAEAEKQDLHEKAFDMTYGWDLHSLMNNIASGKRNASEINSYLSRQDRLYPADGYRMYFTTNHDENSWNGTEFERMKQGVEAFSVLTFTLQNSMPLLYSGQEAGLNRRLSFFERDPIDWKDSEYRKFYTTLINLKLQNKALANGSEGGQMTLVSSKADKAVYAFTRAKGKNKVFVVLNLSGEKKEARLSAQSMKGNYTELFTNEKTNFKSMETFKLNPWEYKVFVSNK